MLIATGGNYIFSRSPFEGWDGNTSLQGQPLTFLKEDKPITITAGKSLVVVGDGGSRDSHPVYLLPGNSATVTMLRSGTASMLSKIRVVGGGTHDCPV